MHHDVVAREPGRVTAVLAEVGNAVRPGDPIARIDVMTEGEIAGATEPAIDARRERERTAGEPRPTSPR